jgi:hypothetical protein
MESPKKELNVVLPDIHEVYCYCRECYSSGRAGDERSVLNEVIERVNLLSKVVK